MGGGGGGGGELRQGYRLEGGGERQKILNLDQQGHNFESNFS